MLKFFLNPDTSAYLRSLANEFGESSNAIRLELNRLEEAGMLSSHSEGNKKIFNVNKIHPLFNDLNKIVRKYIGLDVTVDNILKGLGELERVYLTGDLAQGKDSRIIDLILVGDIDKIYLMTMVEKAEKMLERKIRYVVYTSQEADKEFFDVKKCLLVWGKK